MWAERRRILAGVLSLGLCATGDARPAAADGLAGLRARYPDVRAVLVLRGDCPAFAYYRSGTGPDTLLPLHSMTKSVLSWLIGQAMGGGALRLDETLGELLPEASGAGIDPRVRTVTLRQMLTMTAGLDAEAKPPAGLSPAATWRWSLGRPMLSPPGASFRYDNYGANLLSVILTRRLGRSAEALARETLFGPLGITNARWLGDGDGHSMGAYGLWLSAPDMAKIGLVALRRGRWAGAALVPEAYATEASRPQDPGGPPFYAAYGYLWWVRPEAGAIFAAGSDGQLIYVAPTLDLVVVLASDKAPAGGAVALVESLVLPATTRMPQATCARASSMP